MAERERADMFVSSDEDVEEEVLHPDPLPLQPGEKGMPLRHRGENYTVIEGWRRGTKVYECGSFGYTYENQNKSKLFVRSLHPVIHLKCKNWAPKYGKCPARAQIDERDRLMLKDGERFLHNHGEETSRRQIKSLKLQVLYMCVPFLLLFAI